MATGQFLGESFFNLVGSSSNINLWGGTAQDWRTSLPYVNTYSFPLQGGITTFSAPISFTSWAMTGQIAAESHYWEYCLELMMHA